MERRLGAFRRNFAETSRVERGSARNFAVDPVSTRFVRVSLETRRPERVENAFRRNAAKFRRNASKQCFGCGLL
jgi:hypothetical protein